MACGYHLTTNWINGKLQAVNRVIVTGGAGFIGSAMVWRLNQAGIDDILIVDNLNTSEKWRNLLGLRYTDYLHKETFISQLKAGELDFQPDALVHLGACSVTTEAEQVLQKNFLLRCQT